MNNRNNNQNNKNNFNSRSNTNGNSKQSNQNTSRNSKQSNLNTNGNNSNNPKEQLINTAAQRLGTTPDKLKTASEKGDVGKLLSSLSAEQAQSLNKILGDKDAANKLLSTPQAQALIKKLTGK